MVNVQKTSTMFFEHQKPQAPASTDARHGTEQDETLAQAGRVLAEGAAMNHFAEQQKFHHFGMHPASTLAVLPDLMVLEQKNQTPWCAGAAKLAVDNLLRCSNLRIRDLQRTFLKLTTNAGASGHAWVLRTLCGALETTKQAMTEASEYFDVLAHCIIQVQRQPVEVSKIRSI